MKSNKKNEILIVFDELINFSNLPKEFVKLLKGYNLFKTKCVEFSNIQTSRQQCTPSRSTIMTGIYNTGLQDNIDYIYQYAYIPRLPTDLETSGKIFKSNNYDITGYYGKQHLDSKLAITDYQTPQFITATRNAMKIYGYDVFNVYGDTYYNPGHGLTADNQVLSYILPPNASEYDYIENNNKMSGAIPFIKARIADKKSYYLEIHITNPHDTNHYIQNQTKIPGSTMNQFYTPFYSEQLSNTESNNIYDINQKAQYSVPTHPNLLHNFFENNYQAYKNNKFNLPFSNSYETDYALNPKINSYNPLYIGTYYGLQYNMTMSDSQEDIQSWKNLINNYYGLVLEADSYLEKLYYFFEENQIFSNTNIIIIADHGDQMSAHGLKQKQLPFKECSNVPCLIYSPDLSEDIVGKTCDYYGSLVDILPTQVEMNNLSTNTTFDGKTLLKWSNNKLVLNLCEHQNYIPLNIVNSSMYTYNYFFYLKWYYQNYSNQNLTSKPTNLFNYQSSFNSIIVDIYGTKYKFGRYYSIYSTILYFLFINPSQNIFTKINLIKYIESINPLAANSLISYFYQFTDIFTFENGLKIIADDFGENNVYILYYYYAFIANTLNTNNNFVNLIPGCLSLWETNQQLNIFSYFLYAIDTDHDECVNLMDPKNIDYVDLKLKHQLNDILNYTIKTTNSQELITILPENSISSIGNLIYIFGGFISDKMTNSDILAIYGIIEGSNILDGFSTAILKNKIQYLKINALNRINNLFSKPAALFDENKNIYYVGEKEYVEYIYKIFPYFSNTVIIDDFSNIKNNNFIQTSNNLLPNLQVYKNIN